MWTRYIRIFFIMKYMNDKLTSHDPLTKNLSKTLNLSFVQGSFAIPIMLLLFLLSRSYECMK